MNIPYVKQFDQNGTNSNPIDKSYVPNTKNRSTRRQMLKNRRFKGNQKGISLSIIGVSKYVRSVQIIPGSNKRIEHYLPC